MENHVIIYLERPVEAWNIEGSSDARSECGSWLKDAEEATGRKRGRCSFEGCSNQATVGGHVWLKHMGCFIAPICKACNWHNNRSRIQGAGACLRQNIEVTKTGMTEGMKRKQREDRKPSAIKTSNSSNGEVACYRCGRSGHYTASCYAKSHVTGKVLKAQSEQMKAESSEESEDEGVCFRCGRSGHYVAACYAKRHADGHFLG